MEEYDLVVVGAGVFGLPVAKTFLEVHPSKRLLVLDAGETIGGTWSTERLYDNLYSNNKVGMLEFSDFPLDFETFGVPTGSHVPGTVLHDYLEGYAKKFGVFDKIKFRATVQLAELKDDGTWILSYEIHNSQDPSPEEQQHVKIAAKKLVLATGTTSLPNIPSIKGSSTFDGTIIHTKDLSIQNQKVKDEMNEAKNIVVLGGSKSAADAIYMNAIQGRHVDWVIRSSGKGPSWMSPAYVSPMQLQFEKLATTRLMTFLNPVFDNDNYTWIRTLFHHTRIGRALLRGFFNIINNDVISSAKFNDHPETKKLIPRSSIYWSGTSVGIFNYPTDFFELFQKGLIHVHLEDIDSLSSHTVHLSNGQDIKADMLICATGWKHTPTINFSPSKITDKIGLSTLPPTDPKVKAADAEIMRRHPELENQPSTFGENGSKNLEQPSWSLYRGTVPPAFLQSRNLAYCGMTIGLRGYLIAEITALWITAFFDDKLSIKIPSEEEAEWEGLLQNRFYRYRAPTGLGCKGPDMVFEIVPFLDTLMRDLGLRARRKGNWFKEIFDWYGVGDYKGIVREWMAMEKKNL